MNHVSTTSSEGAGYLGESIQARLFSQNKYKLIATCFGIKVDSYSRKSIYFHTNFFRKEFL